MAKAQEVDPDFFNQTWYLYVVYDSDFDDYFYVNGYQPYNGDPNIPQIAPQVYIESTLNFSGLGICNSFEGTLAVQANTSDFRTVTATVTSNPCGFFEDQDEPYLIGPFGVVSQQPMQYSILGVTITTEGDGFQTMTYTTPPFISYTYRNTPVLGTATFEAFQAVLFPNPVQDKLTIQLSGSLSNDTIARVLSISGQQITQSTLSSATYVMDVSTLSNGLYFIEITTGKRTETLRFVKQ